MKITPLAPHLGALIEGIQLTDMNDAQFATLYEAFLKHKVVFFRDQTLSAKEHLILAKRFGELEPSHPFFPHLDDEDQVVIIETSKGNPPGKSYWHTDMTWQETPPKCSILHAQYVPPIGGDTIWCNMATVWADLSEADKTLLRKLNVVHALHAFQGSRYDRQGETSNSYVAEKTQQYPPIVRPMVQVHPETGEDVLFINEQFTRSVEGMSLSAGKALLESLFVKARDPRYQVRFSWQAGSVAIWDNRATQHFAVTDYGDQARKLHRVTVKGV